MQSGEAPTGKSRPVEASTSRSLLAEKWSRRRPLPAGLISLLTVVFWAVWVYLVLPLISLLLWFFGVRLFLREIGADGYAGLRSAMISYSSILFVLVGLLALWIAWNVVRYGGRHDRRTVKKTEADDAEVEKAFRLDDSILGTMRSERMLRIGLDKDDCVVLIGAGGPEGELPPAAADPGRAAAQRDRLSM